jgi:hypothetical protein
MVVDLNESRHHQPAPEHQVVGADPEALCGRRCAVAGRGRGDPVSWRPQFQAPIGWVIDVPATYPRLTERKGPSLQGTGGYNVR